MTEILEEQSTGSTEDDDGNGNVKELTRWLGFQFESQEKVPTPRFEF